MSELEVRKYTDFIKMCRAISGHCYRRSAKVIKADIPEELKVGYQDADNGVWWQINIVDIRNSCKHLEKDKQDLV